MNRLPIKIITSFLISIMCLTGFSHSSTTINREENKYGLHIPWALPGERIMKQGDAPISWQGEWANVSFNTIRMWDTRTAWAHIQPRPDVFFWKNMDDYIGKTHDNDITDIVYVISGTPEWAATSPAPNSADWIGTNSASPPEIEAWKNFVTQLVSRYKGKITAYEIWNEPNLSLFWQGNNEQLFELIKEASIIIRKIDPNARIVAPAPLIRNTAGVYSVKTLWTQMSKDDWLDVDVLSVHLYPKFYTGKQKNNTQKKLSRILSNIDKELKNLGWSKELWITEMSFIHDKRLNNKTSHKLVRESTAMVLEYANRVYWYAWGSVDAGYSSALIFDSNSGASQGFDSAQKEKFHNFL